jgi:hypothetical protein
MFESYLEELYRKQRAEAQAREEASLAETSDYINRTFNNPRAPGDGRNMCG